LNKSVIITLWCSVFVSAQDCDDAQKRVNDRLVQLNAGLQQRVAARQTQLKQDLENLKKDIPDSKGHPEAAVKLNFKVTSHDQKIILALPDVSMKDQEMILKLPEVR